MHAAGVRKEGEGAEAGAGARGGMSGVADEGLCAVLMRCRGCSANLDADGSGGSRGRG